MTKMKLNEELVPISQVIAKFIKKEQMGRAKDMGGRFVISGIQLGMIKAEIKILGESIGEEKIEGLMNTLNEIHDKQYLGESENMLDDDTNDLKNLFASWLSKANTNTENEIYDSYFTVYWLDGKRDVLKGTDIADALNHAGYGHGALKALDFHCKGIDYDYEWIKGKWKRKGTDGDNNKSKK